MLPNESNDNGLLLLSMLLGEPKYGSDLVPQWKTGWSRYLVLYRTLLEEHSVSKLERVNQVRLAAKEGKDKETTAQSTRSS